MLCCVKILQVFCHAIPNVGLHAILTSYCAVLIHSLREFVQRIFMGVTNMTCAHNNPSTTI